MAQPKPLPPLETLREVFSYDPETGALTWKVTQGPNARAGTPPGGLDYKGYIVFQLNGRNLKAHRVAWYMHHGADPGPLLVDHINRNRSDNRAANLRLVDAKGNRVNCVDNSRPVQVTYPDGQSRLFPSRAAAARFMGCPGGSLNRYLQGMRPHPSGLLVSYA